MLQTAPWPKYLVWTRVQRSSIIHKTNFYAHQIPPATIHQCFAADWFTLMTAFRPFFMYDVISGPALTYPTVCLWGFRGQ
jgi:hypothetical protein